MNQDSNRSNNSEGKVISVTAIFWKILHGWRLIIVAAIVCAMILPAMKYVKDEKTTTMGENPNSHITEDQLSAQDQKTLASAKQLQAQLENKEDYVKSSILMNLNPYKMNGITLQYYVDTDYTFKFDSAIPKDYTTTLVNSYIAYVNYGGLVGKVCKSLNWDVKDVYIAELFQASSQVDNSTDFTKQNASFSVYISGKDDKMANQLADTIANAINEYQSTLQGKIGAHKLTLVDRYSSISYDSSLADKQNTIENSLISLRTQVSTMMATLSAEQKQLLAEDNGTAGKTTTIIVGHPTISKKYIVLGLAIGVFLACVWITLTFVLANRLKTVQEIEDIYNVQVLGKIEKDSKKKKIFYRIDNLIDSLQYKNKPTLEQQNKMILTNLKMTCKQSAIQHLFITNVIDLSDSERKTIDSLLAEIRLLGYTVETGMDIINNVDSFEKMVEIGNVIMIEKIEATNHDIFRQEIKICNAQKVQVLGVLVLV